MDYNYLAALDSVLSNIKDRPKAPSHKEVSDAAKAMTPPTAEVRSKVISYSQRHRGQWHRPEYDFDEIQIAQDTESYIFRSIQKKVGRITTAGIAYTGANPDSVSYIKQRFLFMAHATNTPHKQLLWSSFADAFRFSNCIWAKTRDRELSPGKVRKDITGKVLDPVAGYHVLPMESLQFKTKANGEIKKVLQKMPSGAMKQFEPSDIVHFHMNRKPGFVVGTPELYPALDDVALLRRIEENVEDLIEANLFPVFHYSVGSDNMPEKFGPDGTKETDLVKKTIKYMPAGGIYVSDHRHEIKAIGSEGRALRIDFYISHFKNRALSAIGTSAIDMGEGGGANRSTASTLSKSMLMDIESMACIFKEFLEFYVISELLIEGGFNPLDEHDMVFAKFGVIDKEERRADENQQISLFHANLRTMSEVRQSLGDRPFTDKDMEDTFFKLFEEPTALLKSMGPGTAASEVLAAHPASSVTAAAVSKEAKFAEKQPKATKTSAGAQGRPVTKTKTTAATAVASNKAKPANQHGSRSSSKTNRDLSILDADGNEHAIACDFETDIDSISTWREEVVARYQSMDKASIDFAILAKSMLWRLDKRDLHEL